MNFFRRFMAGRYGPDHLNTALIIAAFVISLVWRLTGLRILYVLSLLLLLTALFRFLSRNLHARRAENDRFLRFWWPIRTKTLRFFSRLRTRIRDFFIRLKSRKTHKFFRCPSCKNLLRVPRGKGRVQITCPKCGERFIRRT